MSLIERKPIDMRVSSYFRTPPESLSGNLHLWRAGTRNDEENPHIALAIILQEREMPVYIGSHILPDGREQIWSLDFVDKIVQMHTLADIRCGQEAMGIINRVSATDPYRLLTMAHEGDPDSQEEILRLLHNLHGEQTKWTAAIAKLYLNMVTGMRQIEASRRGVFPKDVVDGKWGKADVLYQEWAEMVSLRNVLDFPQAVSRIVETLVLESEGPKQSNLPSPTDEKDIE